MDLSDITRLVQEGHIRGVYMGRSVLPSEPEVIRFFCNVTLPQKDPLLGYGESADLAFRDAMSKIETNEMWD